ncbi:hypothetical protein KFL_001800250 [Klebsormidium nitens]|uniref:Uncharacterized protein n=1 Tax=Klebsormidium nitens TaxID=105231 RepID=A0A1Y1I7Y6_KLENI|nr:hypothetical protein KFL_001800250 [Klebsormidium nitens]|eukprot:GAQ84218.1 hypothetical protein KFL_001800250 [Klebsormidium nitens]
MARGRPHGRSKSDHRVCQAARHARAAEYKERIAISAEQQEARIAAVNAECNEEDAPRRRRGQKPEDPKTKASAARVSAQGHSCKATGSGKKKANKRLEHAHGKAAQRDPHNLDCHACGATAEFGLRGSKEGGNVKYSCRVHATYNGCFRVDRDRAAWVEDRELRHLRAEERRLEEELRNLGGTSPDAKQGSAPNDDPKSEGDWTSVAMSKPLITTLLMIGGIEQNPGPTPDEIAQLEKGWREECPNIRTALLAHLTQKDLDVDTWKRASVEQRMEYLTEWRATYSGQWADGWDLLLKTVPSKQLPQLDEEASF